MNIQVIPARIQPDFTTILGLVVSFALIIGAIAMGRSNAQFLNAPAFMIVIFGTMAATSVSYTSEELKHVPGIIAKTLFRRIRSSTSMANTLMQVSSIARKKGLLALTSFEQDLKKDPFLFQSVQLVTDGYSGEDIEGVLGQEIESLIDRHRRAASIVKRAAEIAPAMGLIGTLVGLVQMLSQLDNPASIGPAMAVALLTTFYGAIMGTIVLSPLSAKLERNSHDEAVIMTLVQTAMSSIARQENPRRLEMLLNSNLPPHKRIKFFKG